MCLVTKCVSVRPRTPLWIVSALQIKFIIIILILNQNPKGKTGVCTMTGLHPTIIYLLHAVIVEYKLTLQQVRVK